MIGSANDRQNPCAGLDTDCGRHAPPPHLFAEAPKLLKIPRHSAGSDHGSLTLRDHEQSFRPQLLEGLAHRHLANVERMRNFAFGTENLSLAQLVLHDQLAHVVHDLDVVWNEAVAVDHKPESLDCDGVGRIWKGH